MFSTEEIESKLRQLKPQLANQFGVCKIGYFGSYAANVQTEDSDLDLIVEFSQPVGWSFFTLQKFLEQALQLNIDLVTHNALKDQIKKSVLAKVKYI